MLQCNVFPGLPPDFLDSEVNLFLVPFMDSEAESENPPRAGMVESGPEGHQFFLGLQVALAWVIGTHAGLRGDSGLVLKVLGPFLGVCFPDVGALLVFQPRILVTGRKERPSDKLSPSPRLSRTWFQPALLPAPWVPWPPQFPLLGEQAPEPSDVHGPATAVTHHPHGEELVRAWGRGQGGQGSGADKGKSSGTPPHLRFLFWDVDGRFRAGQHAVS